MAFLKRHSDAGTMKIYRVEVIDIDNDLKAAVDAFDGLVGHDGTIAPQQ